MSTLINQLVGIAVVVFSIGTMFSVGLLHTLRDVFAPMLDSRAVVRALLANFVLVPLWAYIVVQLVPMDAAYSAGLMLVATAAGAPLLIKLTAVAGGNVPLSASLAMLLMPATVIYMPFVVPIAVPEATVTPAGIALPLLWTMILPLCAGLLVRRRHRPLAEKLQPWSAKIANVALILLILGTVAGNLGGIARIINEGAILGPLVVIPAAFAIGWVLGREYRGGHVVLGFGTGQRNIAAAMVVATQGLGNPNAVVMVVVISLVDLGILFPIAWFLRRREQRRRFVTA